MGRFNRYRVDRRNAINGRNDSHILPTPQPAWNASRSGGKRLYCIWISETVIGNKRVPDSTLEKGYNIVTGKLSFEFTKVLSPDEVTPTLVATDVQKLAVPVGNGIRSLTVKEGLKVIWFPRLIILLINWRKMRPLIC